MTGKFKVLVGVFVLTFTLVACGEKDTPTQEAVDTSSLDETAVNPIADMEAAQEEYFGKDSASKDDSFTSEMESSIGVNNTASFEETTVNPIADMEAAQEEYFGKDSASKDD